MAFQKQTPKPPEPKAEPKVEPKAPEPKDQARLVEVKSNHDLFVDQVVGTTFTSDRFQTVQWHPWLQSQISAGWLIEKKDA